MTVWMNSIYHGFLDKRKTLRQKHNSVTFGQAVLLLLLLLLFSSSADLNDASFRGTALVLDLQKNRIFHADAPDIFGFFLVPLILFSNRIILCTLKNFCILENRKGFGGQIGNHFRFCKSIFLHCKRF